MDLLSSNTTKLDKHTTNLILKNVSSMFGLELDEHILRDIQLVQSKVVKKSIINNVTSRYAGIFTFKYNEKKVDLWKTYNDLTSRITDPEELEKELKRIATYKAINRNRSSKYLRLLRKHVYLPKFYIFQEWELAEQ